MIDQLRKFLHEPAVRNVAVDNDALLSIHCEIVRSKPLLRSAFQTFYDDMARLCDAHLTSEGMEIELGSGAGFFKSIRSSVIASDIRRGSNIDIELDAQHMALKAETVRCIYAINVFHHLPDPDKFFSELVRVLRPGGGCILIEPHIGPASAWIHRRLHSDEYFDPDAADWKSNEIRGPLSGANQALAHIVFWRDRARFEEAYGSQLEIVHNDYELNGLRYLLSGGVNFRQLVPSAMARPLGTIERLARPIARLWSLHQVIVLRKRAC